MGWDRVGWDRMGWDRVGLGRVWGRVWCDGVEWCGAERSGMGTGWVGIVWSRGGGGEGGTEGV